MLTGFECWMNFMCIVYTTILCIASYQLTVLRVQTSKILVWNLQKLTKHFYVRRTYFQVGLTRTIVSWSVSTCYFCYSNQLQSDLFLFFSWSSIHNYNMSLYPHHPLVNSVQYYVYAFTPSYIASPHASLEKSCDFGSQLPANMQINTKPMSHSQCCGEMSSRTRRGQPLMGNLLNRPSQRRRFQHARKFPMTSVCDIL